MFCFGMFKSADRTLACNPTKLVWRHQEIGSERAAGELSAPRAMAILEYTQIAAHSVANAATQTTSGYFGS
jgi:hypothetical protein